MPTLYHRLPRMSILHHEILHREHFRLEEQRGINKRHDHIHLTCGALFVDVLVEVGVLGAAGVGEIYLQQPIGVIPEFAPQDILLYQLCRGVEHAGMLPDLNAFYRVLLVCLELLDGGDRIIAVVAELYDIHAVLFRQVEYKPLYKAVVYDLSAAGIAHAVGNVPLVVHFFLGGLRPP